MMMRGTMCAIVLGGVLAVSGVASAVFAGDEDGSKVTITAPADGATVDGASLDLKYELAKGVKAHHAHVYLDGQYQKGFKGTFTNLPPGKHEIKVVAATDDHKMLAAESVVTIEVK
ncbi:MAG: hypothetical protein P0111_06875 [Nitrospira sp.]|nr:hypothetical protein [Nitrospira sp.]